MTEWCSIQRVKLITCYLFNTVNTDLPVDPLVPDRLALLLDPENLCKKVLILHFLMNDDSKVN